MTTTDENTSTTTTLEELRRLMALPVGIVWMCRACPQQGHTVHPSVDAARHDAVRHALAVHRDSVALADMDLRLVDDRDVAVRRQQRLPGAGARTLTPVEDLFTQEPLSDAQEQFLCDVLGCDPQARDRRRRLA
ncbi:hypothetical protein [Streptomyces sp. NBC_00091]|uniref:hypothetical protein n=1 Tax=Streptomyces sp. NBC_00091 TaxID=2975648 RepID=UPI002255A2F5|nr:hypothetical protein [Streptomyces sp. NBC_00091]MCX5374921.1 hypothetical protein [Streptomyces sp. NBC_00091]MCX5380246.1 hypothetical protein [Streptomyces sp. NBC_00091]